MNKIILFIFLIITICYAEKKCNNGNGTKNGKAWALSYNGLFGSAEAPWCGNTYYGSPISFTRTWSREWEYMCFYHAEDTEEFEYSNNGKCNYKDNKKHDHNHDGKCDDNDNYISYGDVINILAFNWNRFFSVEDIDNNIIHANREKNQDWEKFSLISYDNENEGKICNGDKVLIYSEFYNTFCYPSNEQFDNTLFCNYTETIPNKFFILHEISGRYCNKNPKEEITKEKMEFVNSWAAASFTTDEIIEPEINNIPKEKTSSGNILNCYIITLLLTLLI